LGAAKQPGEPDRTLLMAHVLFSRSVAVRRLRQLALRPDLLPDGDAVERWAARVGALPADGLPLTDAGPPPRPGVVSLHDACRGGVEMAAAGLRVVAVNGAKDREGVVLLPRVAEGG